MPGKCHGFRNDNIVLMKWKTPLVFSQSSLPRTTNTPHWRLTPVCTVLLFLCYNFFCRNKQIKCKHSNVCHYFSQTFYMNEFITLFDFFTYLSVFVFIYSYWIEAHSDVYCLYSCTCDTEQGRDFLIQAPLKHLHLLLMCAGVFKNKHMMTQQLKLQLFQSV